MKILRCVFWSSWEEKFKSSHSHSEHIQCFSWGSDHFKVVLEDGDSAAQSLMATPTEQGHTHVEEDSGNEGGPGQTAHTSLTAFLTALKDTKKQSCSADRSFIQHDGYSSWQNVTHDEADGEKQIYTLMVTVMFGCGENQHHFICPVQRDIQVVCSLNLKHTEPSWKGTPR